jgi:hypothetical protein
MSEEHYTFPPYEIVALNDSSCPFEAFITPTAQLQKSTWQDEKKPVKK